MRLRLLARETDLIHVACEGDVTLWPLAGTGNPLEALLGSDGFARGVLLDLSGAHHLDSCGISWLIGTHQRCCRDGGRLVVHSPGPRVRDVLDLVRLGDVLPVAEDAAEAAALVRGSAS